MRNPYPQSINIVSVIRPSSLQLILWYDPLSPGIIALAPTRACHFPRARGTPHLGRQPRQPGDSEQLQQLPGRRTDLTPGQSYQARGEEKTGNSGGDLQREESSGGCDMTHDTWHMTWSGDSGQMSAQSQPQSPVAPSISWLLSGWETFTGWWVPGNQLPLNSRPRLIIAVTQRSQPRPGPRTQKLSTTSG